MKSKSGASSALSVITKVLAVFVIIILAVVLLKDAATYVFDSVTDYEYSETSTVVQDIEYGYSEIDSIEIDWTAGNVNILRSDTDKVRVVEKSHYVFKDEDKTRIGVSSGRLIIEDNNSWISIFGLFSNKKNDLTVYLPSKEYDKLDVYMTSGSLEINDVAAHEGEIEITSGKVITGNVEFDEVSYGMTSGNMDINGSFNNVNIGVTSGTFLMNNFLAPKSMEVEVTSGKVSVNIPDNNGFTIVYDRSSGSINSDFIAGAISGKEGEAKYGDGSAEYEVSVTSGNVSIDKA